MLTVEVDVVSVERRLLSGGLGCPGCAGVLAPWGWGRVRLLRGEGGQRVRVHPRRARCAGCRVTHVLLPVVALVRRADLAEVIGVALVAKARGLGVRRIAGGLGRPAGTVRGWLRRFAARAGSVRVVFTGLLVEVGVDPVVPAPAGSVFADAVAAVLGAARAVAARWPAGGTVSPWRVASAATNGLLLAPPLP